MLPLRLPCCCFFSRKFLFKMPRLTNASKGWKTSNSKGLVLYLNKTPSCDYLCASLKVMEARSTCQSWENANPDSVSLGWGRAFSLLPMLDSHLGKQEHRLPGSCQSPSRTSYSLHWGLPHQRTANSILSFVGHLVSTETTQLCPCCIDNV